MDIGWPQQISSYIQELEEQLYEWDEGPIAWQQELTTVQKIIKILMNQTFESTDSDEKRRLAKLEYRTRRIRDCILRRNQMKN